MAQAVNKGKNKPSVSVVIPNLDQGKYLEEALKSVIQQKHLDIRIAVMDAGSTDNSLEIIKKYENQIYYWRSHSDEGQAAAINEGTLKLPAADYICWLNSDDTFEENGLEKMVEFLEQNNDFPAVYGRAHITDSENIKIEPYPTAPFSIKDLTEQCFICQPATLIRFQAWLNVQGLNESLYMCMDYDLWWRLAKVASLGYLEEFTANSRDHEGTKTRNNKRKHYEEAFIILKHNIGYIPWSWCVSMVMDTKYERKSLINKFKCRLRAIPVFIRGAL